MFEYFATLFNDLQFLHRLNLFAQIMVIIGAISGGSLYFISDKIDKLKSNIQDKKDHASQETISNLKSTINNQNDQIEDLKVSHSKDTYYDEHVMTSDEAPSWQGEKVRIVVLDPGGAERKYNPDKTFPVGVRFEITNMGPYAISVHEQGMGAGQSMNFITTKKGIITQ